MAGPPRTWRSAAGPPGDAIDPRPSAARVRDRPSRPGPEARSTAAPEPEVSAVTSAVTPAWHAGADDTTGAPRPQRRPAGEADAAESARRRSCSVAGDAPWSAAVRAGSRGRAARGRRPGPGGCRRSCSPRCPPPCSARRRWWSCAALATRPSRCCGARAGVAGPARGTWVVAMHSGERTKRRGRAASLRALKVRGGCRRSPARRSSAGGATRETCSVAGGRRAGRRLTIDGRTPSSLALGSDTALLVGALEQLLSDCPEDHRRSRRDRDVRRGRRGQRIPARRRRLGGPGLLALQRLRWGTASQDIAPAGAVGSLAAGLRGMVKVRGPRPGACPRRRSHARRAFRRSRCVSCARPSRAGSLGDLADAVVRLAAVDGRPRGGCGRARARGLRRSGLWRTS